MPFQPMRKVVKFDPAPSNVMVNLCYLIQNMLKYEIKQMKEFLVNNQVSVFVNVELSVLRFLIFTTLMF